MSVDRDSALETVAELAEYFARAGKPFYPMIERGQSLNVATRAADRQQRTTVLSVVLKTAVEWA